MFDKVQTIQAQIDSLHEAQVLALQKGRKEKFDGVKIMKRAGPPRNGAAIPPPPSCPSLNVHKQPPQNQPSFLKIGKPGARAGDRPPQRPQGPVRPVVFPPKPPADDPKFRYQAPVETGTRHWGHGVMYLVGTLQGHHKEMDNVPTKNPSSTLQTHPEFPKAI